MAQAEVVESYRLDDGGTKTTASPTFCFARTNADDARLRSGLVACQVKRKRWNDERQTTNAKKFIVPNLEQMVDPGKDAWKSDGACCGRMKLVASFDMLR